MKEQLPLASTLALLRRLLSESWREYVWKYALAFLFMAVASGATALTAWMMKDVINKIFVDQSKAAALWIPAAIVVIFVAKGFASYYQEVSLSRIGNQIVADTQKRLFQHILVMNVDFYQRHPSNQLITRITNGANAARNMLNLIALSIGRDLLTLISLVIVMVTMDPVMSLVMLVAGPIAFYGVRSLTAQVQNAARGEVLSLAGIVGVVREACQGVRIVKSFQLEDVLRARMFKSVEAVTRRSNKIASTRARINPLIETLGGCAVALVVLYAGWRTVAAEQTPGQYFAFITALLMAADPARRLSRVQLQLAQAAIGVQMMYQILDTPAAEEHDPNHPDLVIDGGEVRFEDVSFRYNADAPVLEHLSLMAAAGKTTALVGLSGSGKTTIFNLIQRFWHPSSGEIRIDGQAIEQVSLASLRGQIALVSQDVFLFEGTIRDNIKAACRNASDEMIVEAARAANADSFIRALPKGYDTEVGELGAQISGGQRQRISIARAFLKNAKIILLDEPTSALDSESERIIQEALNDLTTNRTTIVIAHRLATVLKADVIHVIDHGRVKESGSHAELLREGGLYAQLYSMQFATGASPAEADSLLH